MNIPGGQQGDGNAGTGQTNRTLYIGSTGDILLAEIEIERAKEVKVVQVVFSQQCLHRPLAMVSLLPSTPRHQQ